MFRVTILDKNRRGRLSAFRYHYAAVVVIVKADMQICHSRYSQARFDDIHQMQTHFVFVLKFVSLDAHRVAVIGNPYNQRTAAGIQKPG